jgi:Protein of unknown function (DUF3298)
MHKQFYFFVTLCFIFSIQGFSETLERSYKKWQGKIDTYEITVCLTITKNLYAVDSNTSSVKGIYYYNRIGEPIELYGQQTKAGQYILTEFSIDALEEHQFDFRKKGQDYLGTWTNAKTKKKLIIQLKEVIDPDLKLVFEHFGNQDCSGRDEILKRLVAQPNLKDSVSFIDTLCLTHDLYAISLSSSGKFEKEVNQLLLNYLTQSDTLEIAQTSKYPNYKVFASEIEKGEAFTMIEQSEDMTLFHSDSKQFIFKIYYTNYAGGAHPNSYEVYLNIDRSSGKVRRLEAICNVKLYQEKIKSLIKQQLELNGLWANTWFTEGAGASAVIVPSTYALLPKGILFLYNPYEAAAYAAGPIQVFVKYKDIDSSLKY